MLDVAYNYKINKMWNKIRETSWNMRIKANYSIQFDGWDWSKSLIEVSR